MNNQSKTTTAQKLILNSDQENTEARSKFSRADLSTVYQLFVRAYLRTYENRPIGKVKKHTNEGKKANE